MDKIFDWFDWCRGVVHDIMAGYSTFRYCRDMRRGHCHDALPF